MKWISMLIQFLMNMFVKKAGAEEIEAPKEAALPRRALLMAEPVAQSPQQDIEQVIVDLQAEAAQAKADAEKAKADAAIAKAAKEKAASEQAQAEASAEKSRAELEAKLSSLAKEQAAARQAEYNREIVEADALIGKSRLKQDESFKSAENIKRYKEEIAEIEDEGVFCGTQFSPGGDCIVWVFKRIGADVILVERKLFNSKDFNSRPGSRHS